jgi:type IV pilus assembly protein PilW
VTALRARIQAPAGPRRARGVTLVELMVALVLGLVVAGAALAVLLASRTTYVATEDMGRLQENGRVAFELMSRDLRAAATVPCSSTTVPEQQVIGTDWWKAADASEAQTFWGTTAFTGTSDTLQLMYAEPIGTEGDIVSIVSDASGKLTVGLPSGMALADFVSVGDMLMACDYGSVGTAPSAAIFTATAVGPDTISHDNSQLVAGMPMAKGIVSQMHAVRWYVDDGVLMRQDMGSAPARVIDGVQSLAMTYLVDGDSTYSTPPLDAADWANVIAVHITLAMAAPSKVDGQLLTRTLTHVVAIRNRAP